MEKERSLFKLSYNAIIQTVNLQTKEILKETKVHNIIVDDGLERVAHLIGGLSSSPFIYVGIGQNASSAVAGDTDLNSEVARAAVTPTDEGAGIIEYDHTFSFGTGQSYTIQEAGLFDSGTISGGTMLNRLTFSSHAVDVDNGLRVRITITVSR